MGLLLEGSPLEIPIRRNLMSQAGDTIFHPRPELRNLLAWAQFIKSGHSTEDIETKFRSRAPSMNKMYAFKWRLFTSWWR